MARTRSKRSRAVFAAEGVTTPVAARSRRWLYLSLREHQRGCLAPALTLPRIRTRTRAGVGTRESGAELYFARNNDLGGHVVTG